MTKSIQWTGYWRSSGKEVKWDLTVFNGEAIMSNTLFYTDQVKINKDICRI